MSFVYLLIHLRRKKSSEVTKLYKSDQPLARSIDLIATFNLATSEAYFLLALSV
jgi:hypothetical protein